MYVATADSADKVCVVVKLPCVFSRSELGFWHLKGARHVGTRHKMCLLAAADREHGLWLLVKQFSNQALLLRPELGWP